MRRTRKKKQKNTRKNIAGVIKYENGQRRRHLKPNDRSDCGAQVFQALGYTTMEVSKYLQKYLEYRETFDYYGINCSEISDMMNIAYKKQKGREGSFDWVELKTPIDYAFLRKHLKKKTGTFMSIYYPAMVNTTHPSLYSRQMNSFKDDTQDLDGHVVALFRKYVKKTGEDEFYVRDPQMRSTSDPLFKLSDYIKKQVDNGELTGNYPFFYMVINTKNEYLDKYQITKEVIDEVLYEPNQYSPNSL